VNEAKILNFYSCVSSCVEAIICCLQKTIKPISNYCLYWWD